jgi:hypothetical protein
MWLVCLLCASLVYCFISQLIGCDVIDLMQVLHREVECLVLVNMLMNFRVPQCAVNLSNI